MVTWHWHCSCGHWGSATANVLAQPGVATELLGKHLDHDCDIWPRGHRGKAVKLDQWRLLDLWRTVT